MPRHEGDWGVAWGCWRPLGGQDGCSRVFIEAKRVPKTPPGAPETTPKHRNHDPLALSTFQSLPSHDLSALPSDYERREALERAAKSRSIGPVDVSELQGAQNSNSGGVEAAILDTFIVFEPPRDPLGPLHFDPPGIPTSHHTWVPAPFLSKNAFSLRRELDFRFARKTTSPKTD